MNAKHLLGVADDDELKQQLQDLLCDQADWIDLNRFCRRGGYFEIDDIDVTDVDRDDDTIAFTLVVSFTESVLTSCADVELNNSKACQVQLEIDKDGDITIGDVDEMWDGGEYAE